MNMLRTSPKFFSIAVVVAIGLRNFAAAAETKRFTIADFGGVIGCRSFPGGNIF
jgi:hypothetical protein